MNFFYVAQQNFLQPLHMNKLFGFFEKGVLLDLPKTEKTQKIFAVSTTQQFNQITFILKIPQP